MFEKCPGRDSRNLKAEPVRCLCGYDVEIFSDEMKRNCPRCGKAVSRKQMPSCAQWCKSAEACLGFRGASGDKGEMSE
jgi:hypothetical protein